VILDGATVSTAAGVIGEGLPIGALAGGLALENWASFDSFGINENGDWMMTGDTGGPTATDEFVAYNGKIVYREGMTLDGEVLTGSIGAAYMNEAGDIAFQWQVTSPGGALDAIYLMQFGSARRQRFFSKRPLPGNREQRFTGELC
jgi:hypothetical protein